MRVQPYDIISIYGFKHCRNTQKAVELCKNNDTPHIYVDIDEYKLQAKELVDDAIPHPTPLIYINGKYLGSYEHLEKEHKS